MSNNAITKNCKKTPKKRLVSFYDPNKIPILPSEKENLDSKDIILEDKSTASSQKTGHSNKHTKRRATNKSSFKKKLKKVSFKEDFTEVVHIENWKMYNSDVNDNDVNDKPDHRNKDKTTCACIVF